MKKALLPPMPKACICEARAEAFQKIGMRDDCGLHWLQVVFMQPAFPQPRLYNVMGHARSDFGIYSVCVIKLVSQLTFQLDESLALREKFIDGQIQISLGKSTGFAATGSNIMPVVFDRVEVRLWLIIALK